VSRRRQPGGEDTTPVRHDVPGGAVAGKFIHENFSGLHTIWLRGFARQNGFFIYLNYELK
jgi:hypothetical protein